MPPKQNRSVTANLHQDKKKGKVKMKRKHRSIRWDKTKETHSQRSKIKPS